MLTLPGACLSQRWLLPTRGPSLSDDHHTRRVFWQLEGELRHLVTEYRRLEVHSGGGAHRVQ